MPKPFLPTPAQRRYLEEFDVLLTDPTAANLEVMETQLVRMIVQSKFRRPPPARDRNHQFAIPHRNARSLAFERLLRDLSVFG